MRVGKRTTGAVGVLALTAGGLVAGWTAVGAAAAPSASAAVVINEVYGGGGNTGATWKRDFVELTNVSTAPVVLDGWSIQYASTAGTTWAVTPLSGSLPSGTSYVVGEAAGAGGTTDVPVDVSGGIAMGASGGKVALVRTSTAMANCGVDCSDLPDVVDFVGWGAANDFAGSGPAPATSNTTSVSRDAAHTNTPNNAADFTLGTPTPTACGQACVPPPPPVPSKSIAEIQGAGATSPLAGQEVATRGVVVATYPSGGFRGFYLQTEGTGGERDLTGASDGLFVFQPSGTLDADATIGNYVEVTGTVSEFSGLTEITATSAGVTDAGEEFDPVTAVTNAWPGTAAGRESIEGMLYRPSGDFTVTSTFATNQFGEVGLAVGTKPLIQPTEVAAPGSDAAVAVAADNLARAVTLDDGASTNFMATSTSTTTCGTRPVPCLTNGALTPPYLSATAPVRVGAPAAFSADVVVDYRFNLWRFQPVRPVTGPANDGSPVAFTNTRTAAPDAGKIGDAALKVASFNVLNFFTTLGEGTSGCVPYTDRDGDGSSVRSGCALRGAWDAEDLGRQRAKTVAAINSLDADVVGLMEVENSEALGELRDEALDSLVAALNADAGAGTWAFVPSSTELPDASTRDVITNGIIFKPATVQRVGDARALGTMSDDGQAFGNAREPIAQVFKKKNGLSEKFLFVVNHFKSKGSAGPFPGDEDTGDGQAASTTSRILQAQALRDWVPTVLDETGTRAVVLAGDFNSYTQEDPLVELYEAGYTDAATHFEEGAYSYSFSANRDWGQNGLGLSGSLDHVLLNPEALALATGADTWNINAGESVAFEYSRWNYHGTDFHAPNPYRSADHDPVVVGLAEKVKLR